MRYASLVKLQTVPLLQNVEDCNREGQPHLEILEHSLPQSLEIAHLREQREHGFDHHSLIGLPASANLDIRRIALFGAKTVVHKHNHLLIKLLDQRVKRAVGDVGGRRLVSGNQSELVCHKAQFAADNPSPIAQAFLGEAFSARLAAFPDWVTQFDAEAVGDAQHGRFSQKAVGQPTVRFQAAKQSCAFGQAGKQEQEILLQPTIKGVLRCAFEGKQQTDGDKFARREFGFRMLFLAFHSLIYSAKQVYDKFFVSHAFLSSLCCVWSPSQ